METNANKGNEESNVLVDPQNYPEDKTKHGFLFFWWDAYEDEKIRPGVILFFGKTYLYERKEYVSCCVILQNVERKVYLLPREFHKDEPNKQVFMKEVSLEAQKICQNGKIRTKTVTKSNPFDPNDPNDTSYLELRYSGNIDFANKTCNTFSKVYGQHSSFLENFLLDKNIKGPCWLKVLNHRISDVKWSHTAVEIVCDNPGDVIHPKMEAPIELPPLTVLSLNIRFASVKSGSSEIAMISCLVDKHYCVDKKIQNPEFQEHFCVVTKLSNGMMPQDIHQAISNYERTTVQKLETEKALLNYFLNKFATIDPDLVVGHDLKGYQFSILAERLKHLSPLNFSRLSRVNCPNGSFNKYKYEHELFVGRLVCDVKISAKELITSRSYDLESLCQVVLKLPEGQRLEVESEDVPKMYEASEDLLKMISLTTKDASYALQIMCELNVVPLALEITNIAGNLMSHTLQGGYAERIEFLLLHAFNNKDFIMPEKQFDAECKTYSGGLVLEPLVGIYDKYVLLMDFNSLYPSIIQEFNICFTTISNDLLTDETGILPMEMRVLINERNAVKKIMQSPDVSSDLMTQYQIKQKALKIMANSMYGCLGYSKFRFYAPNLAALITEKGREILMSTRDIIEELGHKVIYGDTDSVMIETNLTSYEQVVQVGEGIKEEINKRYKLIELDIDGVFKYLLLLKKKKYAAVSVSMKDGNLNEAQEIKGLDFMRRDWSQLAAQAGKYVLNEILSAQTQDERIQNIYEHLTKLKADLENDRVPVSRLVITKQLTRDPEKYAQHVQAHVHVALRNNRTKAKKFKAGDTVPYIICNDNTNNSVAQRAYLPEQLKTSNTLAVDTNYYLAHQILPVVTRICEPVEGTDSKQIANLLGFEKDAQLSGPSPDLTYENFQISRDFRDSEPFCFKCVSCNHENKLGHDLNGSLENCVNKECPLHPYFYIETIQNSLASMIKKYEEMYNLGEYKCENPGCDGETLRSPQHTVEEPLICHICNQAAMYCLYTQDDLYNQLLHFQHIFDIDKQEKFENEKVIAAYSSLKEIVDHVLRDSPYLKIKLDEVFAMFTPSANHEITLEPHDITVQEEYEW